MQEDKFPLPEETEIKECIQMFTQLLKVKITETQFSPFIVSHPVFNSAIIYLRNDKGEEVVNVLEIPDRLPEVYRYYEKQIENCNDITKLMCMVQKPYRLVYFYTIFPYLCEKDYNDMLRFAFTSCERPSDNTNIDPNWIWALFLKSNKNIIMDDNERDIYAKLPEKVDVYRGYNDFYGDNVDNAWQGLSWTLSLDTAKFYAERFGAKNQYIAKTTIHKNDIFALWCDAEDEDIFSTEKECVIDYTNIEKIEIIKIN